MNLARFPRLRLTHLPKALERMENLSRLLGGPEIWIKRDDCTGMSTGGNKTRKLEFLMADVREQGADIVLTQGSTQSNHARQTAAFAAKLGMDRRILLEDRTGSRDPDCNENGNVFLDLLHGAKTEKRPGGLDKNAELDDVAARMKAEGRKPYAIPGGGSNVTGALGYVNRAQELMTQASDMGPRIDHLVHATGSAGTQAGLIAGLTALNAGVPLPGVGVRAPKPKQEENVHKLAQAVAERLGLKGGVPREAVVANCDHVGEGCAIPAADTIAAIEMFAREVAILLDPVYSGKGAAGLIDLIRKGCFRKGGNVVFLHTGGAAGLFGCIKAFDFPGARKAAAAA